VRFTSFSRVLAAVMLAAVPSAVPGAASQAARGLDEAWASVAAFFEREVQARGIVGASLLVIHHNQVLGRRHVGLADRAAGRPVGDRTIFHWASITKTVTGIAIMQLRDRGRLRLDDPVVKYLPELRAVHNPHGSMEAVTIRHLMTHSAGFRGATWPWGGDQPWHPHEPAQWEQLVAMAPYTQILFSPGSRFSYSNPGIVFLGRVIEVLTGDDYEVYADKNVFKPLGMHRTYFDTAPFHLGADLSLSYYRRGGAGGTLDPARTDVDTGITVSNGGMNAPLDDMAKYLDFLLGNPSRQAEYDDLLDRRSLEEMFQPAVPITDHPTQYAMGLLFFRERARGHDLIGHSGTQNGFMSHIYVHPSSGLAYVVAFNTTVTSKDAEGRTREETREMDDALRDEVFGRLEPEATGASR